MAIKLRQGSYTVLKQLPGKSLTLLGPLVLYQNLGLHQYAVYEASFAIASILAILMSGGLAAALPYDVLDQKSSTVWQAMRRRFTVFFSLLLILILLISCTLAFDMKVQMNELRLQLVLMLLMACGTLGQIFVSAALRLRHKYFYSAISEHSGWLAAILALPIVCLHPDRAIQTLMLAQVLNLVFIGATLRSLPPALHRDDGQVRPMGHGSPIDYLDRICPPFLRSQLSILLIIAAGRSIYLLAGHATAAAYSALAFRLAAPMMFFYQTLYAAGIHHLFNSDPHTTDKARSRIIVFLAVSSIFSCLAVGLFSLLHPSFFSGKSHIFYVSILAAIQTLCFYACCEVLALGNVGSASHRSYGKLTWIGSLVVVACIYALTFVFNETSSLLILAILPGMTLYLAIFSIKLTRQVDRLNIRKIIFSLISSFFVNSSILQMTWFLNN